MVSVSNYSAGRRFNAFSSLRVDPFLPFTHPAAAKQTSLPDIYGKGKAEEEVGLFCYFHMPHPSTMNPLYSLSPRL